MDRLDRLKLIAERFLGPVSAAIYVQVKQKELPLVMDFIKANPLVQQYVDIHLLYQFQNEVGKEKSFY